MKWGSVAKHGDTRILKKYAWFPIRIKSRWGNPEVEWRWLEQVKIKQEYIFYYRLFGGYWESQYFMEFDLDEKRDNKLKKLGI